MEFSDAAGNVENSTSSGNGEFNRCQTALNTPLSVLKLAELASEAGIPAGVFNVVAGPGASVGELLATHLKAGTIFINDWHLLEK